MVYWYVSVLVCLDILPSRMLASLAYSLLDSLCAHGYPKYSAHLYNGLRA